MCVTVSAAESPPPLLYWCLSVGRVCGWPLVTCCLLSAHRSMGHTGRQLSSTQPAPTRLGQTMKPTRRGCSLREGVAVGGLETDDWLLIEMMSLAFVPGSIPNRGRTSFLMGWGRGGGEGRGEGGSKFISVWASLQRSIFPSGPKQLASTGN